MEEIDNNKDHISYLNIGNDILDIDIRCRELINWLKMIENKKTF